jgi:N-acylneuraminate cytidylyltransferase
MTSQDVLGIIPARQGSKGIPRKNLRLLAGKPLIAYAAEAAWASGVIDRLIVSTESEEIADLARALGIGVPFMRPAVLASDSSPMLPVVEHAVGEVERAGWSPSVIVLLQPTSPLRTPEHLRAAIALLVQTGCDSVVSVVEVPKHYSPYFLMRIEPNGRLTNFLPEGRMITRRQDAPSAYSRDGTVYATRRRVVMEEHSLYGTDCRPLVLRSEESVNLDMPEDWSEAERRLAQFER